MIKKTFNYIVWSIAIVALIIIVVTLIFIYGNLDTLYASGYSHSGFNAIKVGMKKDEVENLIGIPLHISTVNNENLATESSSKEIWIYSKQGKNKKANFLGRFVEFDGNELVLKTTKELYID